MASPLTRGIKGVDAGAKAARIVTAAVIGGTTAKLGGGKFANGAISAAFVQAFNAEQHPDEGKSPTELAKEKLTHQPLADGELNKANPDVGQGCGAFHCRTGGKHDGVDIGSPVGTEIKAAGDGTVSVGYLKGYGKTVLIDHGNGVQTRYAHLSAYSVNEGAKVSAGAVIGKVGTTGNVPTGGTPHLHFEVIVNKTFVNPSDIFTWKQAQ